MELDKAQKRIQDLLDSLSSELLSIKQQNDQERQKLIRECKREAEETLEKAIELKEKEHQEAMESKQAELQNELNEIATQNEYLRDKDKKSSEKLKLLERRVVELQNGKHSEISANPKAKKSEAPPSKTKPTHDSRKKEQKLSEASQSPKLKKASSGKDGKEKGEKVFEVEKDQKEKVILIEKFHLSLTNFPF